ncbi:MAG: hypothetical protein QOK25_1113 [Thermoleophilaceae bacterium]|jgi:dTDP-4-amino-4,6-dideoxygalactose transaminase|nr:hypothetical protein [Thermoleophilaceae bacterium]
MRTPTDPELSIPFLDLRRATARVRAELDRATAAVLDSGRYLHGERVARFEEQLAATVGAAHAVGVASGTDALELALRAIGVGAGDEVVTQANTCPPTIEAIRRTGATPVLCDADPESGIVDLDSLGQALSPRTRAIVPVHLHGQCADMDGIAGLAGERGVDVVEDCAQAHGARYRGRAAGSLGRAASFSFYPTKNLGAVGDAGAVVTDDAALAERLRRLAAAGGRMAAGCRMDEIQAAVLLVKLPGLAASNRRRAEIADVYRQSLAGSAIRPLAHLPDRVHAYHHFVVRTDARDAFRAALAAHGVETAVHYPRAVHEYPGYEHLAPGPVPLAGAEQLARAVVSLPLFPELTDHEVAAAAGAARKAAGVGYAAA